MAAARIPELSGFPIHSFDRAASQTRLRASERRNAMTAAATRKKPQTDHDILAALNTEYIKSVWPSAVKRFDEILSPEFYCSTPDGARVADRAWHRRET